MTIDILSFVVEIIFIYLLEVTICYWMADYKKYKHRKKLENEGSKIKTTKNIHRPYDDTTVGFLPSETKEES